MFSPYYAFARRRGAADPLQHCAFNVSLTGARTRWSMSERGRRQVERDTDTLRIGPSDVHWDGACLTFALRERGCPLPHPIRGTVRVWPTSMPALGFALDGEARHLWTPLAPRARINVQLSAPSLRWQGKAYFDSNRGTRALERDFSGWTWSRAALPDHTRVFYEVARRSHAPLSLALRIHEDGRIDADALPRATDLPPSGWRIARRTRSESPQDTRVLRTLVDAPFYARSLLATRLSGQPVTAVHESLDLDRFRRPLVQCLLPFRMPRWRPGARVPARARDPSAA